MDTRFDACNDDFEELLGKLAGVNATMEEYLDVLLEWRERLNELIAATRNDITRAANAELPFDGDEGEE